MITLLCPSEVRDVSTSYCKMKNFLQDYFPGPATALPACNVGKLVHHLQLQGNVFSVANLKPDIKVCYYLGT